LYNKVATTDDQCLELLTLINAGADVNWKHPQDEDKAPLHAAVIFDKVVYIELLIQNGADIFQLAARKWTPMV
jgi:ankyrin repeat protein